MVILHIYSTIFYRWERWLMFDFLLRRSHKSIPRNFAWGRKWWNHLVQLLSRTIRYRVYLMDSLSVSSRLRTQHVELFSSSSTFLTHVIRKCIIRLSKMDEVYYFRRIGNHLGPITGPSSYASSLLSFIDFQINCGKEIEGEMIEFLLHRSFLIGFGWYADIRNHMNCVRDDKLSDHERVPL